MEEKPSDSAEVGIRKAQKLGHSNLRVFGTMSPPMARGWSVLQLDHDEEMVPMHGMHGTLDAELEVQRTIKRAELTAFLCLLRKAIGPTTVHIEHNGIIDGLWRCEMRCIGSRAKDADLWIMFLGRIA